jgi:hypothetical protein
VFGVVIVVVDVRGEEDDNDEDDVSEGVGELSGDDIEEGVVDSGD